MLDEKQSLSEHFHELRLRLFWVVVVFIISLIASLIFADDVFRWIRQDALAHVQIHALAPGDSLKIYMQISFLIAFVATSPVILYQLWQFVRPGLKEHEQRATLLYIPLACLLFLLGIAFGYWIVFPYLIQFTANLNQQFGLVETYGVYQYFSFLFNLILPLALFFELPIIVLFLSRLRIVTVSMLRKMRRIAYFLLVVIGALISPPDLISNVIISIPLIILYEISLWIAAWVERKQAVEEADSPSEGS
jgi:sec-independent protein translocase protein TatC